jgi:hypothetical protein
MKLQPILIVLTVINLAILILTFAQLRPAVVSSEIAPMLRGRGLEIVDENGKVRASIKVYPANTAKDGKKYEETVLLRLITEKERPSVKISASDPASGLSFAGPTGTNQTYVQLISEGQTSFLRLKNEDGKEQLIKP